MKKFTILKGIAAVMPDINIDTDAIIPKQFLKTIHRKGLGKSLFYNERYTEGYNKNVDFIDSNDVITSESSLPPARDGGEIIEGETVEEKVNKLIEKLKMEAKVI